MKKRFLIPLLLSAVALTSLAATDMTDGEIRKIDKDAKKLTIKHADIKNLQMPAMTMVFQVKDPALLEALKAGDKVRFKVESTGGALVITEIEAAK
jgi:Cu(I)/Ag(I) efflux system periplasmic protein CusF